MKYKFVVILFFLVLLINCSAQTQDPNNNKNSIQDSLITKSTSASINELKQLLNMSSIYDPFETHFAEHNNLFTNGIASNNLPGLNFSHLNQPVNNFEMGRLNIKNAIKMQPNFMGANDLGVFGDILLYTNFAAAGYVLYQHIKKYKDEY